MKWGCSTLAFRWHSLDVALNAIADLGFEYVDIGSIKSECEHLDPTSLSRTDISSLGDKLASLGLRLVALNICFGAYNDPCAEVRNRQVAWTKASMDIARALDASIVTTSVGQELDWQPRQEALRLAIPRLRECANYGKERGVSLALEMPHKYSLARNMQETIGMIDLLSDIEGLGITLDTSQVIHGGDSVTEMVKHLGERIVHVHLRDARGRYTRVAPGRGEVDFNAFFTSAEEVGYRGVYAIEFEVDEYSSTDVELTKKGVREARDYLKAIA